MSIQTLFEDGLADTLAKRWRVTLGPLSIADLTYQDGQQVMNFLCNSTEFEAHVRATRWWRLRVWLYRVVWVRLVAAWQYFKHAFALR